MKYLLLASLLATLTACASSPNQPDNREWVKVTCNGAAGWTVCSEKALSLCSNGYDIANKEENLVTGLRAYEVACKK